MKTGQIKRNKCVADRLERGDNLISMFQQTRKILRLGLDARHRTVVANAQLPQTQPVQQGFGAFHLRECFQCNGGAVRDARGEAGRRRLVPVGQAQFLRLAANFRFGEAGFQQRAAYVEFTGGFASRPKIAGIVCIGAIHDGMETMLFGVSGQLPVGFFLAEETAVGRVRQVGRI